MSTRRALKVLYIGDVMAQPGIDAVEQVLPQVVRDQAPDVIVAQAENVTDGKSMSLSDMQQLRSLGVDFFTGGNHTPANSELHAMLEDPAQPVIGPINMPGCPGQGWKYFETGFGRVLFISLLGATVGREVKIDNPLKSIDDVLRSQAGEARIATIVNFHGDYSSEKRIIGYYLDGRVSAVVGDHWHVPTSDAMVLPKGTAHMTDVGMCGSLHSSLGVSIDSVLPRWLDGAMTRNQMALERPYQFCAALITIDTGSRLATNIEHIYQILH